MPPGRLLQFVDLLRSLRRGQFVGHVAPSLPGKGFHVARYAAVHGWSPAFLLASHEASYISGTRIDVTGGKPILRPLTRKDRRCIQRTRPGDLTEPAAISTCPQIRQRAAPAPHAVVGDHVRFLVIRGA